MYKTLKFYSTPLFLLLIFCTPATSKKVQDPPEFTAWLGQLKAEAISRNISAHTLDRSLTGVKPLKRVIELDRRQSEFILPFWNYLSRSVNKERIKRGRELLRENDKLLNLIYAKYKIQPRFLISFWVVETNFGSFTGVFPVVSALVTLAHDRRRSGFFRTQLFALLELIDKGHMSPNVKGSWAGAMGNHQFLPTTYRDYAKDFDGDGKLDLWGSKADTFASAANYLKRVGWDSSKSWGREVKLPPQFRYQLSGLKIEKELSEWEKLGIRKANGKKLPKVAIKASLILPAGYKGPAFLVYSNFRKILVWNRSVFYALAVGILADRIIGNGALITPPKVKDHVISRQNITEMQKKLTSKGFNTNGVDGILGPQTREAIRSYQKQLNLPQDGYPTRELLEKLKN